ncbi:MAG: helical backbone metal receptor, partial [Acidilobaceae archaeon]
TSLTEKMEKVATIDDLRSIYLELSELRAHLSGLEERNSRLREAVEKLEAKVREAVEALGFPLTIRDSSGKEVLILRKPQRVVSLAPSVTESIYYIGALDKLVGVDDFSNFPPVILEMRSRGLLKSIGGFWNPNVEVIIALKPDLVIGVVSTPSHLVVRDVLSNYGIPVILLGDRSLSEVIDSLIVLGLALGRAEEAYELAWRMRYAVFELTKLVERSSERSTVAMVIWVDPIWVAGRKTWQHDLLILAGFLNVYEHVVGWQSVSPESLLTLNPSVIVLSTSHGLINKDYFISFLTSTLGEAAYRIEAVKHDMIIEFSDFYEDSLLRPSPRAVVALYALAIIAHPYLFELSDPPKRFDNKIDLISIVSPYVSNITLDVLKILTYPEPVMLAIASS